MKKALTLAMVLMMILALPLCGFAAGITLRTTSNFFDVESVAQAYTDALVAYEQATGNTIEDNYTGLPDEMWRKMVENDLTSGGLDLVYYYTTDAASAKILPNVVPMDEVRAAYPDAGITVSALVAERDGHAYAAPVTGYFTGLFINRDLFELHGVELPTDWNKLEAAIAKFKQVGIAPMAASLSDYPNGLVEVSILASGTPSDYIARPANSGSLPQSWANGMGLIRRLYELGAFPANVNQTTQEDAARLFREKEAAMMVDGSWFAATIPQESWDSTYMIPFPVYGQGAEYAVSAGDMTMGFYISRAAWEDPQRRDAVVQLMKALTTPEMQSQLSYAFGDTLRDSYNYMVDNLRGLCPPIADAMTPEAREAWFKAVPGIADGSVDPAALLRDLMDRGAFAQQ